MLLLLLKTEIFSSIFASSGSTNTNFSETYGKPDVVHITNVGNAPATNISVILTSCITYTTTLSEADYFEPLTSYCGGDRIHNITNTYSTVNVILSPKNVSLEPGSSPQEVNRSIVKILVPRLVQGPASFINLQVAYKYPQTAPTNNNVFVTYDQGSTSWPPSKYTINYLDRSFFIAFYLPFYGILALLLYRYVRRRRARKRLLTNVIDNIMQIRGALRSNHTDKNDFADEWDEIPALGNQRPN
jgi:hypothetical protein